MRDASDLCELDDEPEPDEIFDAELAAVMLADHEHDSMTRQMRRLGERLGALHAGMLSEGMDPDDAAGHVTNWMECAVFQRIARETGTLGM